MKLIYIMVVIMYILEFKRNLLIFDYEWNVYVKLYEKSFIVYLFLLIELCVFLVIILKIKNFFL